MLLLEGGNDIYSAFRKNEDLFILISYILLCCNLKCF